MYYEPNDNTMLWLGIVGAVFISLPWIYILMTS